MISLALGKKKTKQNQQTLPLFALSQAQANSGERLLPNRTISSAFQNTSTGQRTGWFQCIILAAE